MIRHLLFLPALTLSLPSAVAVVVAQPEPLWQIGTPDGDYAEFALTGEYRAFNQEFADGVEYRIGESESKDWPYIQPGTEDSWAESREHPFTITFDAEPAESGYLELAVHLTSAHSGRPPQLTVALNGMEQTVETIRSSDNDEPLEDASAGTPQVHRFLFPPDALRAGSNRLTLTTDGSWMLYDALEFFKVEHPGMIDMVEVSVERGWYRTEQGPARKLQLEFPGQVLASAAQVEVEWADGSLRKQLNEGEGPVHSLEILLPMEMTDSQVTVTLALRGEQIEYRKDFTIAPEREWEIWLVHQTHLDIGYTDTQENVLQHQIDNLYEAMGLIEENAERTEGARFSWHPEGMWAVEEFMRIASDEERETFVDQAQARAMHMDSLYAQAMTGAYSEEELFALMDGAARFCREYDIPLTSAMQSDVPGYTWGLVSALAHYGVKYISAGPNSGHRVGHTFEWGDRPFYWVSPSGHQRVLFWMTGVGYNFFHGREQGSDIRRYRIFDFLDRLEEQNYPYEMVMMRYAIGWDNGPPNPAIIDVVNQWNDEMISPRLVLSTNSEVMRELESRHGDELPVLRGDYTPYWEDGMASTAKATGISRRVAEDLVQTEKLWSMVGNERPYPYSLFDRAWNKLIMYDEHTWGAHNSISAPESDFAIRQDEYKQNYALDGQKLTRRLSEQAFDERSEPGSGVVDVYNTLEWPRSELVVLTADQSAAGDRVETIDGAGVPSQRLADGSLAFLADVPPLAAARYRVVDAAPAKPEQPVRATATSLDNDLIALELNGQSGAVSSLRHRGIDADLVAQERGFGVNDYLYILGRDADENNRRIDSDVRFTVEDAGPLVGTLRLDSDAPGANHLQRRVRLVAGSPLITLMNVVDKYEERRPEGVYFNFPFNVPDGTMRIDTPWAVYQPEKDQILGANKNFFVVQRFVDFSNDDYGITWMSLDAPIVQWDPIRIAQGWRNQDFRRHITPNMTIHSWVMNNHWETNYKAYQKGKIPFEYALLPRAGAYDAAQVQRAARAQSQPLLAIEADAGTDVPQPLLRVEGGDGLIITAIRPSRDARGLVVRLFNVADEPVQLNGLDWSDTVDAGRTWIVNPLEERQKRLRGGLTLQPKEIVTLYTRLGSLSGNQPYGYTPLYSSMDITLDALEPRP